MGKSLRWYILPTTIEHDKTKQICIDLEFEPENDDFKIKEKVYKIMNPESEDISYLPVAACWNTDKKYWCPKCHMYAHGLYGSSLVIDEMSISHSYSNSIWNSDWNVRNLNMGCYKTDFVRRFNKNRMYREICKDNLESRMKYCFEEQGNPIRTSDVEAKDETLSVVNFLNKYLGDDRYRVIIHDES
jgi:hypothetical protein